MFLVCQPGQDAKVPARSAPERQITCEQRLETDAQAAYRGRGCIVLSLCQGAQRDFVAELVDNPVTLLADGRCHHDEYDQHTAPIGYDAET